MLNTQFQRSAVKIEANTVAGGHRSDGLFVVMTFWGLMGLLAWAPLPLASNRPWSWSLLGLAVGVLLIFWALLALRQPSLLRLSWHRYGLTAALFLLALLWMFIQTTDTTPDGLHAALWQQASNALGQPLDGSVSVDPNAGREGLMRLLTYGGVFWLAAQFGRDRTYARQIMWCVVLIGTLYAVYGVVIYSSGNKWILWYERWAYPGDLTSTFVSRSAFGAFAGVALLSALALLLRSISPSPGRGRDRRAAAIAYFDALPPAFYGLLMACVILATALMLTHSRGAVAVTAIGLAIMMVCLLLRQRSQRRSLFVAACLIAIAGIAILELSGRVTLGRALQLADQGTGREAIHATTRRAIDAAPVTGNGLDTFRQLYFQYRDLTIPWASPRYDKAHSTYLELVLEAGLIGFGLLMAAICAVVFRLIRGILDRRRDVAYPACGLGVTALIGTHAVLDFSVQIPAVAVFYAAVLGTAYAQSWPTDASDG